MLRIYPITLLLARDAALAAKLVTRHDPDLARQLRRAGASVPLSTAEGYGSLGGHKRQRYGNALGSAYEVRACLDTASAMDYIPRAAWTGWGGDGGGDGCGDGFGDGCGVGDGTALRRVRDRAGS